MQFAQKIWIKKLWGLSIMQIRVASSAGDPLKDSNLKIVKIGEGNPSPVFTADLSALPECR